MACNIVLFSSTVKPVIWACWTNLNEIFCGNTECYCNKRGFGLWLLNISHGKVSFQMRHGWEHPVILEYCWKLDISQTASYEIILYMRIANHDIYWLTKPDFWKKKKKKKEMVDVCHCNDFRSYFFLETEKDFWGQK